MIILTVMVARFAAKILPIVSIIQVGKIEIPKRAPAGMVAAGPSWVCVYTYLLRRIARGHHVHRRHALQH